MFPMMVTWLIRWFAFSMTALLVWVVAVEVIRATERRESRRQWQRREQARRWAKAELERFTRRYK